MPVVWEDPDFEKRPRKGASGYWPPRLNELSARPGIWAKLETGLGKKRGRQVLNYLRSAYAEDGFEFTFNLLPDGIAIFGRRLAEEQDARLISKTFTRMA